MLTPDRMDDTPSSDWDEPARTSLLHALGILDTPPETDFDDLVQMASEICDTPIALISLVDKDRQFFKAERGLGLRETPIQTSFCVHAIQKDETMVVPDATCDTRFSANPLVTGDPGVRFYAGAPLKTREGVPIGTICVLDYRPRQLDDRQIRHLEILARQAMTQIELRRALAEQDNALRTAQTAERRRDDVSREMAHRMRNVLAIVQAIVTQTFRHASSMEESRAAISARVAALSRAQDMLTAESGTVARICNVVEVALAPHRTGQGRFHVEGPDIPLTGPQVLGLTLALHELASNSAKYGALSGDTGTATLRWSVERDGGFEFTWVEAGGPPVAPPERSGFGSRLLERIVASYFDGSSELDLPTDGLRFRLTGDIGAPDAAVA